MQGSLPQESDSQRIGHLAQRCFNGGHPDTWRPKPLDGTDDFGFDYQVQTVVDSFVRDVFRVQLKGTTAPSRSADGSFFSVQLKASTVRYYERATEPILLVLCDLSANPGSPTSCPLYFCWVEEELRRINRTGIPPKQDYVTLRVPSSNLLSPDTDVSEHVAHHRAVFRAGRALDERLDELRPGMSADARASLMERIPKGFGSRSYALVEAMTEIPATPWPEAKRGTYPWHLKEAAQHLREGDADSAHVSLQNATSSGHSPSELELAEHAYLSGRVLSLNGDDKGARDAYAEAARISKNVPRYVTSLAEAEIRLRHGADVRDGYADVLAVLHASDSETLSVRSRVLAAAGKTEEALAVARSIGGHEGQVAQAIVHTMLVASQEAIDACTHGLAEPGLPEKTRQILLMLRARSLFRLALQRWFVADDSRVVPLSGPADADIDQLRAAWRDIEAAAASFRKAGWPPNIEFLADVWSSTAAILGRQDETLPLLAEAAAARPHLTSVQAALESLAVQSQDLKTALTANARQQRNSEGTLRRIALLHMDGQHAACVDLMSSAGSSLDASDPLYAPVLAMAALSADRVVRNDLANSWEEALARDPKFAAEAGLLGYFRSVLRSPLSRDEALRGLVEKFDSLGGPLSIALNVLLALDPGKAADAEACVRAANVIRRDRLLPLESALHVGHALVTLEKWAELQQLTHECMERFGRKARLIALEALALDRMSHTPAALESLQSLIASAEFDALATNTYINIAVRCGMTDAAISSVESILSRETRPAKRLECLRLLFGLLHQADPRDLRCVEVAWRIGELSSPDKEEEEGLFLVSMFVAGLYAEADASDPRIPQYHQRLQAFTARFPESRLLRSASLPDDASGEEVLTMLREVSGWTEEKERWRQRVETQMQRGDLPVPYAWRPKVFIAGVHDVPALWELTKRSRSDQKQLHLMMSTGDWQPARLSDLGPIPLLDLTALLVLYDLGLLDELFRVFPSIAVGQRTLLGINQLISPITGSFVRDRCAELQSALKRNLPNIRQPVAPLDESEIREELLASEEIKWLVKHEGYLAYSDDVLFRIYCADSDKPTGICTLDVLQALDDGGHIQPAIVAAKLAQLCDWHVGLTILARYQTAALPDNLGMARSVRDGVELLRGWPVSASIFRAIWGGSKPYKELLGHASALLRELVDRSSNAVLSIASLMALWHEKVRLRPDAPTPPVNVIGLLVLQAAYAGEALSPQSAQRLWSVFRLMVENEYGDRMDERKEAEAIALLGDLAARNDVQHSLQGGRSLHARLVQGLTDGTKDAALFCDSYSKARVELASSSSAKS